MPPPTTPQPPDPMPTPEPLPTEPTEPQVPPGEPRPPKPGDPVPNVGCADDGAGGLTDPRAAFPHGPNLPDVP